MMLMRAQPHTHQRWHKKKSLQGHKETDTNVLYMSKETMTNWESRQRKEGIYIVKWTGAGWNKRKDYSVAFSLPLPPILFVAFSFHRFKRDSSHSLPSGQRSFQVFGRRSLVSDGSLWLLVKRGIKNTQICLKNVLFSLDLKTVGIISYLSFIVLD